MVKETFNSEPPSTKKRKTNKSKSSNEVVKEKEWIEAFGMKDLSTGTRLLGIIVQVTSLRLKVALPNMLTGVCDVADISHSYRHYLETQKGSEAEGQEDIEFNTLEHLFQPGQYVLCSVKSVDTTPPFKVHVTIDPEVTQAKFSSKDLVPGMIVSASVVSHEDHGVQFNFGIKNQTGFLPTSEVASYGQPLPVGRVILASVQKTNGRVSTLSLKKLATVTAPPILTSIDSLNPGLLVDAKVDQVLRNGVSVLVMGYFSSTISRLHLPHGDSDDWAEHYSIGSSVRARVTVVDTTALSKTIQLSLLPHVVSLVAPPLETFPAGHLFPQAVIVRAEGNHGLVCLANLSSASEETALAPAEESDSNQP